MFRLLFLLFGAGFCGAVFLASLFIALGIVFGLQGIPEGATPTGVGALVGQFVSVLIAMGATFATFAGLRWVWRGFGRG